MSPRRDEEERLAKTLPRDSWRERASLTCNTLEQKREKEEGKEKNPLRITSQPSPKTNARIL